jgi:predicted nucleotidyltransferase
MEVQPDFRELLALLNDHKVEYIVIGGYALAFHGVPRLTADLDILVKPDPENALHIMQALDQFGFKSVNLCADDFQKPDQVIQLGLPPVRVDILTSITGVSWTEVFLGRVEGEYGDIRVFYIGREQFIANKRATGRKRDLADLEALGED